MIDASPDAYRRVDWPRSPLGSGTLPLGASAWQRTSAGAATMLARWTGLFGEPWWRWMGGHADLGTRLTQTGRRAYFSRLPRAGSVGAISLRLFVEQTGF